MRGNRLSSSETSKVPNTSSPQPHSSSPRATQVLGRAQSLPPPTSALHNLPKPPQSITYSAPTKQQKVTLSQTREIYPRVFTKNISHVKSIISSMKREPERLQLAVDFDHCLTNPTAATTWSVFDSNSDIAVVPAEFPRDTLTLAKAFYPPDRSTVLTEEEKVQLQDEWFFRFHSLLLNLDLSRAKLDQIAQVYTTPLMEWPSIERKLSKAPLYSSNAFKWEHYPHIAPWRSYDLLIGNLFNSAHHVLNPDELSGSKFPYNNVHGYVSNHSNPIIDLSKSVLSHHRLMKHLSQVKETNDEVIQRLIIESDDEGAYIIAEEEHSTKQPIHPGVASGPDLSNLEIDNESQRALDKSAPSEQLSGRDTTKASDQRHDHHSGNVHDHHSDDDGEDSHRGTTPHYHAHPRSIETLDYNIPLEFNTNPNIKYREPRWHSSTLPNYAEQLETTIFFRHGFFELLHLLNKTNTSLMILTAGISNVIHHAFNNYGIPHKLVSPTDSSPFPVVLPEGLTPSEMLLYRQFTSDISATADKPLEIRSAPYNVFVLGNQLFNIEEETILEESLRHAQSLDDTNARQQTIDEITKFIHRRRSDMGNSYDYRYHENETVFDGFYPKHPVTTYTKGRVAHLGDLSRQLIEAKLKGDDKETDLRSHVIVMGDALGDRFIANSIPHADKVLKIGYFNIDPNFDLDLLLQREFSPEDHHELCPRRTRLAQDESDAPLDFTHSYDSNNDNGTPTVGDILPNLHSPIPTTDSPDDKLALLRVHNCDACKVEYQQHRFARYIDGFDIVAAGVDDLGGVKEIVQYILSE